MKNLDGNRMDLTRFINAYRGPLIGLIASWGAPWADAAEIAQDSFVEAWIKGLLPRGLDEP
jgi:RNA polymerase sigma-70 factor (ECF subfamily)